jgi:hypothetical protein
MDCNHEDFSAMVDVNRLEDIGRFTADVRIECTLNGATVSGDGCEARLAIAPKGDVIPPIDGLQGFSIRKK